MTTGLRNLLGTDLIGTTALHLLSSSLAPTTYANYDSGLRQFAAFCHEENIHPLLATTQSVVRYTAWLGLQGTVAAASLQQYYSAINKFFRDHQQQPIAVGELLADARRGLEMHQQRLQAADSRLPLPAPLALSLLTAAATLSTHLQWTPTSRHLIARFRALLAVCTTYAFFCRAESGVRCLSGDLVVDRPSQKIWLFIRKAKGDQRRSAVDKPILAIPTTANPVLADLLEYYCTQRTAYCNKFYNSSPPAALWSFVPYENSSDWQAAATLSAWLRDACDAVGATPPGGFKWTSHSLRKGAASAASCIGTPLHVVKYMGGWAKNSSVTEGKYIDPTMTPSPAAWQYFGWLVPANPLHHD